MKLNELFTSFNPFIQVFYFYRKRRHQDIGSHARRVLIPLFRSFIFTLIAEFEAIIPQKKSFNPFIQVFYFYAIAIRVILRFSSVMF